MRVFDVALWVAPCLQSLKMAGFDVVATQNFQQIQKLVEQTGRSQQTPMMDISRLDFTQSTAFWLFLMRDGVAVGGMGVKYVDLGGEAFEQYLRRTSWHQYACEVDPIQRVATPLQNAISRRLIYFGELELRAQHRGKKAVLAAFAKLAKALAAMQWPDFDWMYALIPDEHVALIPIYGFSFQLPNAITWNDPPPPGRLNSHWLVGVDRLCFEHVAAVERLGLVGQKPK